VSAAAEKKPAGHDAQDEAEEDARMADAVPAVQLVQDDEPTLLW